MSETLLPKKEWIPTIHSHFRLQWEETQQAYVLLYPEGMIKLNFSGGEILSHCNGKSTIQTIIEDLQHQFPDAHNIEQDVLEFLSIAFGQQWLTTYD